MDAVRVLIHALGFLVGAEVLEFIAVHTGNPGLGAIIRCSRWGAYVPFRLEREQCAPRAQSHDHRDPCGRDHRGNTRIGPRTC
jgi:hypothetical protein